jgi:hypothetical protein
MLGQCFANPAIFSIFGTNYHNEVISSGIVGVEEVGDQAHQPEATGENDELIFCTELLEEGLLVFLGEESVEREDGIFRC